jgi:hypothetical protein
MLLDQNSLKNIVDRLDIVNRTSFNLILQVDKRYTNKIDKAFLETFSETLRCSAVKYFRGKINNFNFIDDINERLTNLTEMYEYCLSFPGTILINSAEAFKLIMMNKIKEFDLDIQHHSFDEERIRRYLKAREYLIKRYCAHDKSFDTNCMVNFDMKNLGKFNIYV